MRYLILADVHGNMPALEAVLAEPEATRCDRIISLGDQINFGPQSREVLERLTALGATLLLGNHEDRLLHPERHDLSGYNWTFIHWTNRQLRGFPLDFPTEVRIGPLLFTHGMPGELSRLLTPDELPPYLDALPEGVTHLFTGHTHRAWHTTHNGRVAVNPGAVGAAKSQSGSCASYAIYDDENDAVSLRSVPYDVDECARAFLRSGAVDAAPQMCRIVLQTMYTGCEESVSALLRHIAAVGKPLGLTLGDEAAWHAADATFSWTEPLSTPDYWKMMEDKLL